MQALRGPRKRKKIVVIVDVGGELLRPVRTTPNGNKYINDGLEYYTTIDGEKGTHIGTWVSWGGIQDQNIAIECKKHRGCRRSASRALN